MKNSLKLGASAIAMTVLAGAAWADGHTGPLKVGVLATLEGTYTALGEDGVRGIRTALEAADNMAGGREIEIIIQSTDTSPDSAVRGARKLVEQDGVEIVIGPLSGSEGIAIRDFSKTQPDVTFINGSSGALETTYVDPSENFFRFNTDGGQWSVGLGRYVFEEKGWEVVATVGEDYSFVYTQVMGFTKDFCEAGGEITERLWVPLGTKDFGSIIAALPDDVDAIYLGLGGGDAVNFLNQYQQAGGDANLIGGTIMVDGTVLNSRGDAKNALIGTPSSGPQADTWDNENWQNYVKLYQDTFAPEDRFPSPSLLATTYYNATSAMLQCVNDVGGNLGAGQADFRNCLTNLELESPTGTIRLDENRQAIAANFISEVVELEDGTLANEMVGMVDEVTQTLGLSSAAFDQLGLPSRDTPECLASYE
ncbi:ABC transporter substrate-binding protein [Yoonia sp. BS5-3]|uniref:ABC transporter substrate-binding protein n=1 Tax=Yoonia phaeophyticola TaxID=3137369 RepID=A0ABZ2V6D4_9RHOB